MRYVPLDSFSSLPASVAFIVDLLLPDLVTMATSAQSVILTPLISESNRRPYPNHTNVLN